MGWAVLGSAVCVCAELSPLWESSRTGTRSPTQPGSCVPNLSVPTVPLILKNGLMGPSAAISLD